MLNTQTMNLDLIRTFVIVGQSKDFNEASSKLSIDHTNVSRHIKALENLMGTKLIKKNSKNYIELTDDGKALFDGYEKAYNLLFITEKTFLQNKDLNSGKISIGIANDIELDLLSSKIENFKKNYFNTAFKIVSLPVNELYEKLAHYNIDFVIDEKIELKKSSGIANIDLYKEKYCLVYLDSKYNIAKLSDLDEIPLILPVSSKGERKLFENLLQQNGVTRNLSVETSNYIASIDYAKKGLGVALIPQRLAKDTALKQFNIDLSKQIAISYVEENLSPSSKAFLKEFTSIDK